MRSQLSLVVMVMVVCFSASAMAMPAPVVKTRDGLMEIVKSPMHVKNDSLQEAQSTAAKPLGFVGGLFKGTFYMGKDIVSGVYKVVTSPLK